MNLASRGLRNMDTGMEKVTDSLEVRALRQQARKVYLESLVAAVVLTAASLAVPMFSMGR
ncbi:MAG TPA: hypothetical protein VIG99_26580 [Myxococcaceae bacterium]